MVSTKLFSPIINLMINRWIKSVYGMFIEFLLFVFFCYPKFRVWFEMCMNVNLIYLGHTEDKKAIHFLVDINHRHCTIDTQCYF